MLLLLVVLWLLVMNWLLGVVVTTNIRSMSLVQEIDLVSQIAIVQSFRDDSIELLEMEKSFSNSLVSGIKIIREVDISKNFSNLMFSKNSIMSQHRDMMNVSNNDVRTCKLFKNLSQVSLRFYFLTRVFFILGKRYRVVFY